MNSSVSHNQNSSAYTMQQRHWRYYYIPALSAFRASFVGLFSSCYLCFTKQHFKVGSYLLLPVVRKWVSPSVRISSKAGSPTTRSKKVVYSVRSFLWRWKELIFEIVSMLTCRSQWQSGLRRGSAVARLLRLRVRIPPGARMFVCGECCVCQVEVSATGWSLV